MIEKAPRDLPLYASYVLKILAVILRSRDITMVESSIPTFQAFCEHHDAPSLSADQEYLNQYEDIVRTYASFASTKPEPSKTPISAPVAMRWRSVGLEAIKSVATSEALASQAGKQLDVIVPMLLENLWTDDMDYLSLLQHRARVEEKVDTEKLLRRRTSIATVRTAESSEANAVALSGTTADADKLAEEDIGVLAIQCLKAIFVVNNRAQIYAATTSTLNFIEAKVSQNENVLTEDVHEKESRGWATRMFEIIARWTPVQDRYVILVTAMDVLVRSPMTEDNLKQQVVLATMVDSLLRSDINLIGLSVMDVLLGLIQHVLRTLQLGGAVIHPQQEDGFREKDSEKPGSPLNGVTTDSSAMPSGLRHDLLARLQDCIGDLATHVYYADQISDMVSAILLRLKPSVFSSVSNGVAAVENPAVASAAVTSIGDLTEDTNTDGFFSFDTAKVKALHAIRAILLVASQRSKVTGGGSLGRNRVPVHVWEGTQWLLRDVDGRVRKAYVEALTVWLDKEMTKSNLKAFVEKPKGLTRTSRDESATNLSKRAVSNASNREKAVKAPRTTFLPLLHLAVYENVLQYANSEVDIVLLHFLLAKLVEKLGVNAVKESLPMIYRLQEDILEVETPISKIRIGSLCHGYFWVLSEKFNFDSSPVGRTITTEIKRRRSKGLWVDPIRSPPIPLEDLGTPGQTTEQQSGHLQKVESESLTPFDDRFQLVKLISLTYSQSLVSPPSSPSTSPGRSFTHPILSSPDLTAEEEHVLPEAIKDSMMSEWTKESVIAAIQESSKTVSLNGSKTGTNATGHRNFLAVNGNRNESGTGSPQLHSHTPHSHGSKANSTYGLVGGLGVLQKLRKGTGFSPSSPASDSSHASVTRVGQLKKALAGQDIIDGSADRAHSDGSSDSMVSYDYTPSEVSYNPAVGRSASQKEARDRSRSKSRDRIGNDTSRPLTSHPVLTISDPNAQRNASSEIPPVPPIPSAHATGEVSAVQDYAQVDTIRKSRSVKRATKSRGSQSYHSSSWGNEGSTVIDLESLLNGIDVGGSEQKGNVAKPPY